MNITQKQPLIKAAVTFFGLRDVNQILQGRYSHQPSCQAMLLSEKWRNLMISDCCTHHKIVHKTTKNPKLTVRHEMVSYFIPPVLFLVYYRYGTPIDKI
jgi:hypothetical protein